MGQLSNRFQAKCEDFWHLLIQDARDFIAGVRECFRRGDERG